MGDKRDYKSLFRAMLEENKELRDELDDLQCSNDRAWADNAKLKKVMSSTAFPVWTDK